MVLHHYQSNSGKDLILEYVKSLPADEKKDKKKIKKDKKIVIKWAKEIGKLLGRTFIPYKEEIINRVPHRSDKKENFNLCLRENAQIFLN